MTDCRCQCHVNPRDYVPVCPTHKLPLYAAEAGQGQCPWAGVGAVALHRGGALFTPKRCITWGPRNWHWLRRDLFNGLDLPPHNGYQAPRYPSPGGPVWDRHEHHCGDCDTYTVHVVGDNRSVCTECGSAVWVPDPQYVNAGET